MADHSIPPESTTQAGRGGLLLSALSRWWSPAAAAPAADPVLGYESALPWTLGEDAPAEADEPRY